MKIISSAKNQRPDLSLGLLAGTNDTPLRFAATQDKFLQSCRHVWWKSGATDSLRGRPLAANSGGPLFDFPSF
jgi:hypothetical protein